MAGLRATITLERYKKGGGVERRQFPSRSFLLGLLQILYCQHSSIDINTRDVAWTHLMYSNDNWFNMTDSYYNLFMNPGGGRGVLPTAAEDFAALGIIVGIGDHAVTSDDRGLHKKISPTLGMIGRTLPFLGNGSPWGIAYDGTNLYYVDQYSTPSVVYKVDPWTGAEVTHFNAPGNSYSYNRGLTHDGTYLWITGYDSGKSPTQRIYQINDTTGVEIQDWGAPNNDDANGLTWDGTYLWIAQNVSPAQIHKVSTAGVVQDTITPPRASEGAYKGLAWDGTYLWGVSEDTGKQYYAYWICQFNPVGGTLIKEYVSPSYGYASVQSRLYGACIVEGYLWLSHWCTTAAKHHLQQQNIDASRFDYGGCEVVDDLAFSNPNGTFTLRRYFTNKTGGTVTINEVGIQAMTGGVPIARDLVALGQDVLNNETLKVEYTFQITV